MTTSFDFTLLPIVRRKGIEEPDLPGLQVLHNRDRPIALGLRRLQTVVIVVQLGIGVGLVGIPEGVLDVIVLLVFGAFADDPKPVAASQCVSSNVSR